MQWFSTTAWMVWNQVVSGLLLRASVVLVGRIVGEPTWPDLLAQWRVG